MLLLRIPSALAIVVAVRAWISIGEIDLKIYGDHGRVFEDHVSQAMAETK